MPFRNTPWMLFFLLLTVSPVGLARLTVRPALAEQAKSASESDAIEKTDQAPEQAGDEKYYQLLELFADTLDQVERNYVKKLDRRELMEAAIQGVLSKLDPYSNYIPPEEMERFKSGVESEFGGIGIQISIDRGQLTIISPLVGTPAYRAGVLAGDRIIKIEGEDSQGITISQAVGKLKGKVGTKVTFTVLHAHDSSEETVTLTRELVRVDTVMGQRRKQDDSWDYMYDHEKKIGLIRVTAFSRLTASDLRGALTQLKEQGIRGLVLDLRFNPGGLLTSAVEVSDLFISKGLIVTTKGRNTAEQPRQAHQEGTLEGFPMAVLINHYSASASEIVSACLQDHKRAVIIGERSWGKGSVQNIVTLEGGRSALKLTTASYHRPSGKNIHRFSGAKDDDDWGVRPNENYQVKLSEEETHQLLIQRRQQYIVTAKKNAPAKKEEAGKLPLVDHQLQKALQYLAQKLGDDQSKEELVKDEKEGKR